MGDLIRASNADKESTLVKISGNERSFTSSLNATTTAFDSVRQEAFVAGHKQTTESSSNFPIDLRPQQLNLLKPNLKSDVNFSSLHSIAPSMYLDSSEKHSSSILNAKSVSVGDSYMPVNASSLASLQSQTNLMLDNIRINHSVSSESTNETEFDDNCLHCDDSGYLHIDMDGADWRLGFICSRGFPHEHPLLSTCIVTFAKRVMLLFHEFYVEHNSIVSECEQNLPASCKVIDYHKTRVPIHIQELYHLNLTIGEPNNDSLGSLGGRKGYNITFEMFNKTLNFYGLRDASRLVKMNNEPQPENFHAGLKRRVGTPFDCHYNGYPVIRRVGGGLGPVTLQSQCQCMLGSTGPLCQFGSMCSRNNQCSYCGTNGICSDVEGGRHTSCSCQMRDECDSGDDGTCGQREFYGGVCCHLPHHFYPLENFNFTVLPNTSRWSKGPLRFAKCRLVSYPHQLSLLLCAPKKRCFPTVPASSNLLANSHPSKLPASHDSCFTMASQSFWVGNNGSLGKSENFSEHINLKENRTKFSYDGKIDRDTEVREGCWSQQAEVVKAIAAIGSKENARESRKRDLSGNLTLQFKINSMILEVKCSVASSDGQFDFKWYLDAHPITGTSQTLYNADCCTGMLLVDSIGGHEYGIYTCRAFNSDAEGTASILIDPRPEKVVVEPRSVAVRKGGNLELRCVGVNRPGVWRTIFAARWDTKLGRQSALPLWHQRLGPLQLRGEISEHVQWARNVLHLHNISVSLAY
ncbi:uncharacterized protein LOC125178322 [Hyalella azteca]|uniref:Uncharacterized protein LOC125178322 n=1 Tax=Hyalella azteca TaxID=294128 RepID=A0A979FNK0_HYAAZ|nr:uncharacterized protein LOC125178322 [Hyalella azteca]